MSYQLQHDEDPSLLKTVSAKQRPFTAMVIVPECIRELFQNGTQNTIQSINSHRNMYMYQYRCLSTYVLYLIFCIFLYLMYQQANLFFLSELKSYRNQNRPILRIDQRGAYKLKRGCHIRNFPCSKGGPMEAFGFKNEILGYNYMIMFVLNIDATDTNNDIYALISAS